MRIVVLIFAILGAVATAGVGFIRWSALYERGGEVELARRQMQSPNISSADKEELRTRVVRDSALAYFLLVGGILGLVGSVLAMRGRSASAAILLLLAVTGPWVLAVSLRLLTRNSAEVEDARKVILITLMPTSFLAVAGLLALRLRPRPKPVVEEARQEPESARDWEEDEEGEPLPRSRRADRRVPPGR
jgi:hypothetical protein